jgi:hypothetical protein
VQFADSPAAHDVDDELVSGNRPALSSALPYGPVALHRVDEASAFRDGKGDGLFAVHVLARTRCQTAQYGVPAVATGDEHGVDVFAFEHLFVKPVGGAGGVAIGLIDQLLRLSGADECHGQTIGGSCAASRGGERRNSGAGEVALW